MSIFDKLFGKGKNDEPEEKSPLEIFAYAISDVGLWTWYNPKFPNRLQLEFNRTMLYFEAENQENPPPNQIAILFEEIESVFTFKRNDSKLSENWLNQFTEDKLEPFNIDYENFSFDTESIEKIRREAANIQCQFGNKNLIITNSEMKYKLGFLAEEVGLIVTANKLRILNQSGEIELEQIPEIHQKWWKYWEKYWAYKHLKKEIPYDPICEITIPANQENIKKIMKNLK
ncbi:MAG TPA: hypothetical protein ENJ95_04310 [Bacteroidetes bacterium]|nr:hypothetical protein [Bacteroidota bacterium]